MGRFLILVALVVVGVWLLRRALGRGARRDDSPPSAQGPSSGALVQCARCGVHLPRGEAREAGGRLYCGDEHAALGPREGA